MAAAAGPCQRRLALDSARRLFILPTPLDTAPDIRGFFAESLWQERFDDDCLQAGRRLRPKVRELHGEWADEENFTLRAEVTGEHCEVVLWHSGGDWDFESSCGCETRAFCPHAAALLEEAAKARNLPRLLEGKPVRSSSPAVPVLTPAALPEDTPHLELTPAFHLDIVREPTESKVVRLLLQALKIPDLGDWVVARPVAVYGDCRIPLGGTAGPREYRLETASGPVVLRRDVAAEMNAIQLLQQTGLASLSSHAQYRFLLALQKSNRQSAIHNPQFLWFPNPGHGTVAEFWPWLRATGGPLLEAAGWTVTFDEKVGHELIDLDPDGFTYLLEDDGSGWFHLSVGFEVAGSRLDLLPILAELLDRGAMETTLEFPADGHFLHHLDDGRALRLPADRIRRILKQFAALIDPRRFKGGKLKLHPLDAAAIATSEELGIQPPERLAELATKLTSFSGIEQLPRPAGIQAELREYQMAGFRWMQFLARHELHGILADDMGLGKTLQTITHILAEKDSGRSEGKPTLVIAPTSVVPNWRAEANKFAPSLRILMLDGPQRRKYFRSVPYADLVLTSFALVQRDIDKLKEHRFHLVVLDEAQYIKNPAAKVAQAVCQLDARHRLCLSGTPVENHLGELWSLMKFLMPGFLGGQEEFNRRFRNPIEKDGDEDRRLALKARVAPLILRRNKTEVAKELPPKTILVHPVELNTGQKDLYETVRATMDKRVRQSIAIKGLEGSRMVFLEALLKLRQICCEPKLLKFEGESKLEAQAAGSAKLDYLADLLDTLIEEGRRILIFSQFTSMLEIIEQLLQLRKVPYLMLTGASKNRGELVERFQTGNFPVFLISLKAGGTGLNLTAADTVIHYDPWWNPAAEAQATDRAYRIGQTQPVFVHKLICQGTVEERIHQLQAKKSQLADSLLSDAARAAAPDESTLSALLAPLG
ncbi:DEAD/DEAH box helicase [Luteolibacter marinus]|uniref:DEAD/DEAH box helicase n=1 Tax=Luteolibacter marinus TaxID=2776705 RepID=UPI001D01D0F8|nr:DEAD/DEAH box helicase [Luteolibacter marinus]